MKTTLVAAGCCLLFVAACGGAKDPAGRPLAAKACQESGAQAAADAAAAASANSLYNTLAADERAAAVQEAQTGAATGLGSGGAAAILGGQGAGFSVIKDCVSLGLNVTHH